MWSVYNPSTGEIDFVDENFPVKSPSFAPQTDLTGNSLPVSEYTVDVILPEPLPSPVDGCTLYDDMDQRWCSWPISKVINISDNCLRITCSSWLKALDYRDMESEMYDGKTAADAIADCFGTGHSGDYTVSNSIANETLTGFVPEQTARERLTWILFAVGGYARDVYRSNALLTAVDESETLIPLEHTYSRPSVDRADWVTGLKLTVYTFSQGTQEEWEEDDNSYMLPAPWIMTSSSFSLSNPLAPLNTPENVVEIDNLYLINSANVSDIAARLSNYWFNPVEVRMDVINNRAYRPGDLVTGYISEDEMVTGYIQQASFQFGKQAMSTLRLIGVETAESDKLTINYLYNNTRIGRMRYSLPIGYSFSIENPYLDKISNGHRYIYRPLTDNAEGTMVEGGVTVNVNYDIALDLFEGVLHVISVDEVTEQSSGGETIGVIA